MIDPQHVVALNDIIRSRRSIRSFSGQVPDEVLKKIVEAAVYAPFGAGAGIPLKEGRKIFIFRQNTEPMEQAKEIIEAQLHKGASMIGMSIIFFPFLRKKMQFFAQRIKSTAKKGIPGLTEGSFYIVMAEKKGFPAVAEPALAHAMQNMWLTATAYQVGFQLLSVTNGLSKNKRFMKLLGLRPNKWHYLAALLASPNMNLRVKEIGTPSILSIG
ncbi:MAG: nitroreductase [Candidatus Electrothrix sp. AR3]|nr:nitroreductase [Candidatus Electrothrix sp. AR3]